MTHAEVYINHSAFRLRLAGHAEREDCCAAISMLAYTLAGTIASFEEHVYTLEPTKLSDGDVYIECTGDEVAAGWFYMAAIGLLSLEKRHPESIRTRLIQQV